MDKMLEFNFQYRITYKSGESYNRPYFLIVQITKEEYKKIIQGVLQGTPISQLDGIPTVIEKMTERVHYTERWLNRNGSRRTVPLKKERDLSDLEFFLPESEYLRIKKMKSPMEIFERPEEHMTIYRDDGSSVVLSSENGQVRICDSRNKNTCIILDAEQFLSNITRWN